MRHQKRIKRIMNLIEQIWEMYPNSRFNQLIENIQEEFNIKNGNQYSIQYKDIKTTQIVNHVDLFYVEDDKFEEFLTSELNRMRERKKEKQLLKYNINIMDYDGNVRSDSELLNMLLKQLESGNLKK